MKTLSATLVILLAASLSAQPLHPDSLESPFAFDSEIPSVEFNYRTATLMTGLYPQVYHQRSIRRDVSWVQRNDSVLLAFWEDRGAAMLHILTELSGLPWQEKQLKLHLVRFFPTLGAADPLVLPLGAVGDGLVWEAPPEGSRLELNLIYQLARRHLLQAFNEQNGIMHSVGFHPLMRPDPFRADNLAMLLAVTTAPYVMDLDSATAAYNSAYWTNHFPGKRVFEEYFLGQWELSPERTLVDWLLEEPHNSDRVRVTAPARPRPASRPAAPPVAGVPNTGILGFAVAHDDANRLVVSHIDTTRLAYRSGLRLSDQIYRVEGRRPQSHRELVERLLAGLDFDGAAELEIVRDGRTTMIVVRAASDSDEGIPMPTDSIEYIMPLPPPMQYDQ